MKSIRHLNRRRGCLPPTIGIHTTAIACDDFHPRMRPQPRRQTFRRSFWQQVDHLPLFQIQ
jgi:hypothetical protein